MKIHLIVATDNKGGIAKEGKIPWSLPRDMTFFKHTTIGKGSNAIIMGRKTWESLPKKPLPYRINIIVSRSKNEDNNHIKWISSIEEALFWVTEHEDKIDDVFVIGGETIYREFMTNYVDILESIYLTEVNEDYGCDQFFSWDKEAIEELGFILDDEMVDGNLATYMKFTRK